MNLPQGMVMVGDIVTNAVRQAVLCNLDRKSYEDMSDAERRLFIGGIVSAADSVQDVVDGLKRIDVISAHVNWTEVRPEQVLAEESLAYMRMFGGMISSTGALVTITIEGRRY